MGVRVKVPPHRDAERVQLLGDAVTERARARAADGVPFSSVLRVALRQARPVVARVPQRARRATSHAGGRQLPRELELHRHHDSSYSSAMPELGAVDAREAHVLRGRAATLCR